MCRERFLDMTILIRYTRNARNGRKPQSYVACDDDMTAMAEIAGVLKLKDTQNEDADNRFAESSTSFGVLGGKKKQPENFKETSLLVDVRIGRVKRRRGRHARKE